MNDSAVVGAAGKGLMGLLISLAVGLSACTSEYHEFCETLVICHESAVGSSIEDCELTFQNEESEDPPRATDVSGPASRTPPPGT